MTRYAMDARREPTRPAPLPRPVGLLGLLVALVLLALPLVSAVRDRVADARLAEFESTTAGDYGHIPQED
jgi:hypothetical protein